MGNIILNLPEMARKINRVNVSKDNVVRDLTPTLFSTFGVPYPFDPTTKSPKWLEYLTGVQPNEQDRTVLQKLCGLALVPNTTFNVAFFFFGPGGCGKSVFLFVLTHLVGHVNVCCLPLSEFTQRFKTWLLTTNLLNIVGDMPTESESGQGLHHNEGMFKDVCDGGLVPVEHKHQEPFSAPAIARCIFCYR